MSSFWKQLLAILGRWFFRRKSVLSVEDLKSLQSILNIGYELSVNYDGQVPEDYASARKYPYRDRWGGPIENPTTKEVHRLYWKIEEQLQEMAK